MVDTRSPGQRSAIMKSVGTRNTGPEIAVRRILHSLGYRFRLHRKDLPARPDIVLPGRKKVILVHGCFWHGHKCSKGKLPKSRLSYWGPKIADNKKRDARNVRKLKALGWNTLVIWQCETKDAVKLGKKLLAFVR
ncbi:MAG: DNA mismatch endonuclease Vsr [Proteobacteria bacterium]|nr:DNA mismatch endonuclease Vsr [Pseudomonadota bacterium]